MEAIQPFRATWPKGHDPIIPSIVKTIATIVIIAAIAFAYYANPLVGKICLGILVLRKVAMWMIHPASSPIFYLTRGRDIEKKERPKLTGQSVEMFTPDGTKLDGMIYAGAIKKAVVFFGGNAGVYEDCAEEFNEFIKYYVGDITVLFVNMPGVMRSGGSSSPDAMKYASYTTYEYLRNQGYDLNFVCPYGWSLGGFAANSGAFLAQENNQGTQMPSFVERSFVKVSTVAAHLIGRPVGFLVRLLQLEMDSATPFKGLKGKKVVVEHEYDNIIRQPISLARDCGSPTVITLTEDLTVQFKNETITDNHNMPLWYIPSTRARVVEELRQILQLP
jgi:hypothetical protein